jgi:hypothetical protein
MIAAVNTSGAESITRGRAHAEGANLLDRAINDDSETAFTEMAFDVGRAGARTRDQWITGALFAVVPIGACLSCTATDLVDCPLRRRRSVSYLFSVIAGE